MLPERHEGPDDQCAHLLVGPMFETSVADGYWAFAWGRSPFAST